MKTECHCPLMLTHGGILWVRINSRWYQFRAAGFLVRPNVVFDGIRYKRFLRPHTAYITFTMWWDPPSGKR